MSYYRILIMGAAGAGSSTLGKALAHRHHWPHFESDEYYWMPTDPPFTEKRPIEHRVQWLSHDLKQHDSWVVSGVLCNWGSFIIPLLTHVIFLYADWPTRYARIKKREQQRFGERIQPGGDVFEHHQAFVEWASQYDAENPISRTRKKHLDWLAELPPNIQVIRLRSDVELDKLVELSEGHIFYSS